MCSPDGLFVRAPADIEELRNSVGVKEAMRLVTNSCSMTQPLHRESMKACFSNLMDLRRDDCKKQLKSLVHRINNMSRPWRLVVGVACGGG